jgi:hypothetical protein
MTLREAVLDARLRLPGARKIGKNRSFCTAKAIYLQFDTKWQKSKCRGRLHHPSLATVRRIVAEIRQTGSQEPPKRLKNEHSVLPESQLYFYDRYR